MINRNGFTKMFKQNIYDGGIRSSTIEDKT